MIKQLNLKLKVLDIAMRKTMDNIRQFSNPNKDEIEKLFYFYQQTLECYSKNNTVYRLDHLQYTNLNEVEEILSMYGMLSIEKTKISKNDITLSKSTFAATTLNAPKVTQPPEENSQDLFVEQKNAFNANGPVYAFSNEALNQYMCKYDFTDKSVLASLGSGDFALNAYLLGASSVDTFDINEYTNHFYKLKKALILNYNYDDFCNLVRNPKHIFEKFYEYSNLLDESSKVFFERLITIYKGNYGELLKKVYLDQVGVEKTQWNESNTFDTFEELFLIAQYKNYYLQSEENYNRLKEVLKGKNNDEFYFVNIYEFNPNKKYDIVYLSNIGDYHNDEQQFQEYVQYMRENFLNEGGVIIVVSITNSIMLSSDDAVRTKMDYDDIERFNEINKGTARLPLGLGIQNVYMTYPYEKDYIK